MKIDIDTILSTFFHLAVLTLSENEFEGKMARGWTHLISFVAQEDCQIHLGQPVHTDRDIGLDSFNGVEIKAYKFSGTIYEGVVTEEVLTVKQVGPECLGVLAVA